MATVERVYIPSIEQSNAMNAAKEKDITRKAMAGFYADCIRSCFANGQTTISAIDWPLLNKAIIERWSMSGLTFIKDRAWKLVKEGR